MGKPKKRREDDAPPFIIKGVVLVGAPSRHHRLDYKQFPITFLDAEFVGEREGQQFHRVVLSLPMARMLVDQLSGMISRAERDAEMASRWKERRSK